jgi:hypothetical protein
MKNYIALSGSIFAIISFLHLIRIIFGWEIIANSKELPMIMSYFSVVAMGLLSGWSFKLFRAVEISKNYSSD